MPIQSNVRVLGIPLGKACKKYKEVLDTRATREEAEGQEGMGK